MLLLLPSARSESSTALVWSFRSQTRRSRRLPGLLCLNQSRFPMGEAARSLATIASPNQLLLISPPRHLLIKTGWPPKQATCAMQDLGDIQGPPNPNTMSDKVELVGINLNSPELMHTMQPSDVTRAISKPPLVAGQQAQGGLHTIQSYGKTCSISASASAVGRQDQGGLLPPNEQLTPGSCKLITYSRQVKCTHL